MQFSEPYLALLREFEGFSTTPYLCTAGACTIGYGTNLEVHRKFIPYPEIAGNTRLKGAALRDALKKKGMEWDRQTAEAAMLDELQNTHRELVRRCKAYLLLREKPDIVRAECLLDMAYNMGAATLMTFTGTLPMIERGEYTRAAENLKSSKWYKQVGRRSRAICQMLKTGAYLLPSQLK